MLSRQNAWLLEGMNRKLLCEKYSIRDFSWVSPEYTGGSIYVILGGLTDGTYFMLDYDPLGVGGILVDADPRVEKTHSGDLACFYPDWQNDHLIKYFDDDSPELLSLVDAMLRWLTENNYDGNYSLGELYDFRKRW